MKQSQDASWKINWIGLDKNSCHSKVFSSFFDGQISKLRKILYSWLHFLIDDCTTYSNRGRFNVVEKYSLFHLSDSWIFSVKSKTIYSLFVLHFSKTFPFQGRRFYYPEIIRTKNVLLLLIKLRKAEEKAKRRRKKNFWHGWSSLLIQTSKAGYFPWNENVA